MPVPIETSQVESAAAPKSQAPPSIPGTRGRMVAMGALAAVALLATLLPDVGISNTSGLVQGSVVVASEAGGSGVGLAAPELSSPQALASAAEVAPQAGEGAVAAEVVSPEVGEPSDVGSGPESDGEATELADGTLEAGELFADGFEDTDPAWSALTGQWAVSNDLLVQSDAEGYDYINQLNMDLPDEFDLRVRLRATSPELGGGVVLGQPAPGSRKGAYLVDFTAGGSFLRWGRYDADSGIYEYLGGIDVGIDGTQWHDLVIEVRVDTTLVYLDDAYIGAFEPITSGNVGLAASLSAVEFDDFVISDAS